MIQESKPAYLNYYNYHDDQSACSIYKWNDQCVFDQCRMAQTILKHDQIELVQEKNDPKQSKIGFKNAAFLGFKALEHADKKKNLPYCLGSVSRPYFLKIPAILKKKVFSIFHCNYENNIHSSET